MLALAEQQLKQLLPPRLMKSMAAFFSQAKNQLDEQPTARQEREWLKKVRVVSTSQPLLPPMVDEQVFEQVCNALYGDQWLTVEYHNAAGEEKKSRVMPLGRYVPSVDRAEQLLGLREITTLEESIRRTAAWYSRYLSNYGRD